MQIYGIESIHHRGRGVRKPHAKITRLRWVMTRFLLQCLSNKIISCQV